MTFHSKVEASPSLLTVFFFSISFLQDLHPPGRHVSGAIMVISQGEVPGGGVCGWQGWAVGCSTGGVSLQL